MKFALATLLFFVHSISIASVVAAAPPMSAECEAYLKKVQVQPANPVSSAIILQPLGFPAEALVISTSQPIEPKKSRPLILEKDAALSKQPFWKTKPGLQEKMERD